jgi:hypothetical protein
LRCHLSYFINPRKKVNDAFCIVIITYNSVSKYIAKPITYLANVPIHLTNATKHLAIVPIHLTNATKHLAIVPMHLANATKHLATILHCFTTVHRCFKIIIVNAHT